MTVAKSPMTTIAAGDLVLANAFGDHRRPTAYNLYVVVGFFGEEGSSYHRVRPINRSGQHHKDKILRREEVIPLSEFGMRIKRLDRAARALWLEPIPGHTGGRSWLTRGYPEAAADNFTAVDAAALPFIAYVDPAEKEADRP
jgi:hypothetical protein